MFSQSDLEMSNDFSLLEFHETENTHGFMTSSPKPTHNHGNGNVRDMHSRKKPQKIKIMVVNCRSLKGELKKHDILDLIETHKPDVICGQESHIDSSIKTAEIFRDEYNVSRRDRDTHGVVCLLPLQRNLFPPLL